MTTNQTCKDCGKPNLVAIRIESQTVLFKQGPPSKGLVLTAHACRKTDIAKYQAKNPTVAASNTDYMWRILVQGPEGGIGNKNPVWRYFTNAEAVQEVLDGRSDKYLPGSKFLKVEWAKWTDRPL